MVIGIAGRGVTDATSKNPLPQYFASCFCAARLVRTVRSDDAEAGGLDGAHPFGKPENCQTQLEGSRAYSGRARLRVYARPREGVLVGHGLLSVGSR